MRANLRFRTVFAAAGLLLVPGLASAQDAAQPATTAPAATNAPAPQAVGPRELQNFSLPGTSTRSAEQPTTPAATNSATENSAPEESASPSAAPVRRTAPTRRAATVIPSPAPAQPPLATGNPASSAAVTTTATALPLSAIAAPEAPQPTTGTDTPVAGNNLSILPWILAALALAGGTLFLLWRRRPREALAAGTEFDPFVPPEPEPAPAPAPPPRAPQLQPAPAPAAKRAVPSSNGIVASRLRPSLEIGMQPLRCLVEDDTVTIEFEIELFNAGTAPARAVLAEASLLNASAADGQELAAFFASPAGAGERIDAIAPMKRLAITSQVVAPRSAIQEYELGGRKSFVPVVAFNALYEGSGGKAQSSVAYLVGRETNGDKLGPLHLDAGKREFRGLGARPLPTGVRT
jgi:hypothetical protein